MLIQATDFQHLYRTLDCELQMGGADQWGNITAGLELIRRSAGDDGADACAGAAPSSGAAFAMSYPLLLNPSGAKFGKSESGDSVWLHPDGTSPYAFYQHWLNTDDRDVPTYLRWFTLFAPARDRGARGGDGRPIPSGARRSAPWRATSRRGSTATTKPRGRLPPRRRRSRARRSRDPAILSTLRRAADGFDYTAADIGDGVVGFLVATGTSSSKGEARRSIAGGAITINDRRITEADRPLPEPHRRRVVRRPHRQAPRPRGPPRRLGSAPASYAQRAPIDARRLVTSARMSRSAHRAALPAE